MKFLAIFALALATASALDFPKGKLKSRNLVIPAGHPEGRISHGQRAKVGQFPYQIGLLLQAENGDFTWCGGSLISNTKVLTAAHCVDGIKKALVQLGSTHRDAPEVTHTVTSANFIIHPSWDNQYLLNDIAIIDIPYTRYSRNIQPIKLPSIGSYSSYNGDEVVASGWGHVSDDSEDVATNLQFTHLSVMPNTICRSIYGLVVVNSNLCISTYGGSSTCSGDSGGPLVSASSKTQIGLTSFGAAAGCEKGIPVVFTRLSSYLNWIRDNAGVSY